MCCFGGADKLRNRKLRGKSRAERNLLKERLMRRDNSVPDDETSSTTTDSSGTGEQDDKVRTVCVLPIAALMIICLFFLFG
jgi:hypothetical protein